MLATILFLVVLVAFLAAVGRSASPRPERLPWTRWTVDDLIGNVVSGVRRFLQLSDRHSARPYLRRSRDTGAAR